MVRVAELAPAGPVRVGLVQARLRWRAPEANREHLQALLADHLPELDLAVLPETFSTGFLGDSESSAEGMDGATVAWMRSLASEYDCVLAGSAVIATPDGLRNRLLWASPGGEVGFYDKRHLFAYAGEDQRYTAGCERKVWAWHGWRVCPQVCYDIRFPVWCRNRSDYDLLVVVANWPAPRVDAWSTLLRARAIENQCFVVGVNRVGKDGHGKDYPGQSVVLDPLGQPLLELGDEERVGSCRLEPERLREVRERLPFLADADPFELQ